MTKDVRLPPDFGEKLYACLIDAIDHQTKHMGRARLTRDKPQRLLTPDRIASDIRGAMRTIDARPNPIVGIHPMLRELKKIEDRVYAGDIEANEIEDWVWAFTGISKEGRCLDTSDDYLDFAWRLNVLIKQEQESLGVRLTSARGQKSDERLRSLLRHLANIYHTYTGFKATASEATDGGGLRSPFFDFVYLIFRNYEEHRLVKNWQSCSGTVNNAIKHVTSSKGAAGLISEDELIDFDALFPADINPLNSGFRYVTRILPSSAHEQTQTPATGIAGR